MSIEISYSKKTISGTSANLILFTNDRFNTNNLKKYLSGSDFTYINEILKTSDLKNLFVFEVSSKRKNNFSFN